MADIVKTEDVLGGKATIAGHRVSVYQVGQLYLQGEYSPEDIADQLGLSLSEVHMALAYYYDNPDEMEAIRTEEVTLREELSDDSKAPETPSS
ncbi:hypothetical protein BRC85_01875 [Halobacteriales archaeon QS_1_69_70]|nr:MAG: hypothetical protein BRC85_01875 [Halobacteriales archaeon QS_1_69_70]